MRRAICAATVFAFGVTALQSAVHATTLLPGQTLAITSVSAPTGITLPLFGNVVASTSYEVAPTGNVHNIVTFATAISSAVVTDSAQNPLAAYEQIPVAGLPPPDSTHNYNVTSLPTDAVLSISGFGNSSIDVSALLSADRTSSINSVSRSADGNVISLSGFTRNFADAQGNALPIFISDPSVAFGVTQGTLSFVGVDGIPRTADVQVIGVIGGGGAVPEPATLTLLPLAAAGLWARFRRR